GGQTVVGGGSAGSVGSLWSIAGTGDFNGDGKSDILWRNGNSGQAVIWLLNGTSVSGGGSPGGAAAPWTIAETGDFNSDGMSDIPLVQQHERANSGLADERHDGDWRRFTGFGREPLADSSHERRLIRITGADRAFSNSP